MSTDTETKNVDLPKPSSPKTIKATSNNNEGKVFSPLSLPGPKKGTLTSVLSVSPKLTLFEKAQMFRKENEDLWKKQQEEMEEREKSFNEIVPQCSYLEEYYKDLDDSIIEDKKKKDMEKLMVSPTVITSL